MNKKKILDWFEFLTKPRKEFSGPVCPFLSSELRKKTMLIDTYHPQEDNFLDKINNFIQSNDTLAVYARMDRDEEFEHGIDPYFGREMLPLYKESVWYGNYIDLKMSDNNITGFKCVCFSPNDIQEIDGFNPRSKTPYFLITLVNSEELYKASDEIKKTNYLSGEKYEKYHI
tara:strand:- start:392 stop:907 length:516 start_codon:yes stop_codon:yes gene_type:complete